MKDRYKNPWFWIGIIGTIIAATGVDFQVFTSWGLLWEGILEILSNPVQVAAVVMAVIGVFVNPKTKGLRN